MYVFLCNETAIEIGRQIDLDKTNYHSSTCAYFDGNEKEVSKMKTLSLFKKSIVKVKKRKTQKHFGIFGMRL